MKKTEIIISGVGGQGCVSGGNLLALTMEAGRYSVRGMDLLYRARIARFGDPVRTEINPPACRILS